MGVLALIEKAIQLALELEPLIEAAVKGGSVDHDALKKHREQLRILRDAKLAAAGGTP